MATFTVIPHGTYQPGTTNFGPSLIPVGLSKATLAFARSEWLDENVILDVAIDISLDGGSTWNNPPDVASPFPVGFVAPGGVALDKNGVPYTQSVLAATLPQPTSGIRMVRGRIIVTGGPITTTGTLTVV